jgi:hypothetical protein
LDIKSEFEGELLQLPYVVLPSNLQPNTSEHFLYTISKNNRSRFLYDTPVEKSDSQIRLELLVKANLQKIENMREL